MRFICHSTSLLWSRSMRPQQERRWCQTNCCWQLTSSVGCKGSMQGGDIQDVFSFFPCSDQLRRPTGHESSCSCCSGVHHRSSTRPRSSEVGLQERFRHGTLRRYVPCLKNCQSCTHSFTRVTLRHLYSILVSMCYHPTKVSNRVTRLGRCCFAPLR